ncbi:MAG: HAD-IA family hydrolase [Actinomycetota bacterium]
MTNAATKGVVFDFDGTILDTEWSEFGSLQAEYRRHGVEFRIEHFIDRVGRADQPHWTIDLRERVGESLDMEMVEERRRRDHAARIAASDLRPGVLALLDHLAAVEIPVAIASSSPTWWVEGHLGERGLLDRFVTVATSDHVERAKPWPDLFLTAADRLGLEPAHCLAIEDSFHGVTAALAAGMRCVAFPNPVTIHSDLSGADLVVDSLDDLPRDRFGLDRPLG